MALLDAPDLPDATRRAQLEILKTCLLHMKQRLANLSAGGSSSSTG